MGQLTRRYSKVSTTGGKVRAQAVAGVISNSGIKVTSDTGALSILSDLLKITSGGNVRAEIGNKNGVFVCRITDSGGNAAVDIDADGKLKICAGEITVGGSVLSADADGDLCVNGEKIMCIQSGGDDNG